MHWWHDLIVKKNPQTVGNKKTALYRNQEVMYTGGETTKIKQEVAEATLSFS